MTDSRETSATVWALTDDRPGNNVQVLGVAQATGCTVSEKAIRYTGFARLPNIIRRATLAGVTDASRTGLQAPWPDVVIAAGRRSAPVARWIKRQSGGKTKLVQIMYPGRVGAKDFDLIVVPDHDAKRGVQSWPNVMTITGAPTLITTELLRDQAVHWRDRFDGLPRPYIAVVVGGATRRRPFSKDQALELGTQAADLARIFGGSVFVTTSRRTGRDAELALLQVIPEPREVFTWGQDGENPYTGFLALADMIVVTGDSVTMCAEACATEASVFIYAPDNSVTAKHARLHTRLYEGGYARPMAEVREKWSREPLRPAQAVADRVLSLIADPTNSL